jgi:hypothetical protein
MSIIANIVAIRPHPLSKPEKFYEDQDIDSEIDGDRVSMDRAEDRADRV